MQGVDDHVEIENEGEGTPPEEQENFEDLSPEDQIKRLREASDKKDNELTAMRGLIEEFKNRPVERIIEREVGPREDRRQTPSREDIENANARLALRIGTEPQAVIDEVLQLGEERALSRIRTELGPLGADTIIERFTKKARAENPVIGEKVQELFDQELVSLGEKAKLQLLAMPTAQREAVLQKEWDAATGKYLGPKARPKVRPTLGTDTGGRTMGEPIVDQDAPGRFAFTKSQKDAMRRAGIDDKRITAREKAIRDGLLR